MAIREAPSSPSSPGGGIDRLSELPDELLGQILSRLTNAEAGQTAVLSRRWRNLYGLVDTVSLEEKEGERSSDWDTFYFEALERKSCSDELLDGLSAVLLNRRRCNGRNLPLRRFSFAFDSCHWWDHVFVDVCLHHVIRHASRDELHLDLRFALRPVDYCRDQDGGEGRRSRVERDGDNSFTDEDESRFSAIGCLRHRVTTIKLLQYNGDEEAQRMLVWLLLTNAHVLERLCVEMLPVNDIEGQVKHKNDIEGWMVSKLAQATFT
uniref:F-box domain-containing protein n=1 Tax=Leersia perrieri TaxID=77586 RepID=A0A0D9XPT9_9ORYZ